jgi:signal transduction histidine kinase
VAQEALTNARKHAQTERIRLLLLVGKDEHLGSEQLTLEVRDWGQGFVPEEKLNEGGRVGLHSMAERVHLLNGNYYLRSAPGKGTHIKAVFPVREPESAEAVTAQPPDKLYARSG